MLANSSVVTSFPIRVVLISWFWQKIHFRLQPVKKIVPLPVSLDIHGSSHMWRLALAITSLSFIPQTPVVRLLSTKQFLGHKLQFFKISFIHITTAIITEIFDIPS